MAMQSLNFASQLRMPSITKFTRVDTSTDAGTSKLSMNVNLSNQAQLCFTKDTDLNYFKDEMIKAGATKVDFFNFKGNKLPLCETVGNLQAFPVILQIDNGTRIFALNFSQEFKIEKRQEHAFKDQEYFSDFAHSVGIKGLSKHFLPYFSHRLQMSLPNKDIVTQQDLRESMNIVTRYISNHKYTINGQCIALDQAKADLDAKLKKWQET